MQLSQKEYDAVESLENTFRESADYCKQVLREKFFPEKMIDEIEYIIKDNTQFSGYQNDSIVRNLNVVNDLLKRLQESQNWL